MRVISRIGRSLLVGALWLAVMAAASAWALDVPPLTGRVVDLAHVLPPATAQQLTAALDAHEVKTSNQVAVLIVPSLDGEPLFDFSHRVATTWKLGRKGTDNGALLLISIQDRKIRLEVGYGLEGTLTDARAAQIIRQDIVPRFRSGDVPGGVTAGVQAVLKTIEGTYQGPERPAATSASGDAFGNLFIAVVVGVIIGLLVSRIHRGLGPVVGGGLSALMSPWMAPAIIAGVAGAALVGLFGAMAQGGGPGRRGGRGPIDDTWFSTQHGGWGGGGMGGSFGGSGGFSGGGGDFGGGGASGDW